VITTHPAWGAPAALAPPAALPHRAEVVIIGGGITGVALLSHLVARGLDAVLLERDHLAAGASGRNAGFLLAGVAENYARAVAAHGRTVAAEVWAWTRQNHALIAGSAPAAQVGYRCRGSRTVALDIDEAASLEEAATLLTEDGHPVEVRRDDRTRGALLTLFNPADGEIDPLRLVRALAEPHRARIVEGCPVTALEDGATSVHVHAERGSVEASAAVVATNAWTAQLLPQLPIRPVRAQMLATAPAMVSIGSPAYAEWGHRYWRQRDDGTVMVGGFRHRAVTEEVGYHATPTERVQRHLNSQLRALGVGAQVTHRWAGIMGFSADGLPLAGAVPGCRRIHVCGGYTGHGLGFALRCGRAVAGLILDGEPLPGWLDVVRTSALRRAPTRR
jgi:glycine/D-amino acid oxidase-like deaminating enzyme